MSQRPPKKNSSRRNRAPRKNPPAAKPSTNATDATQSGESAASQASASKAAARRETRRLEAQKKAKQKRQLQLLAGGVALAVVVAVLLIFINRPSNEGLDIDYDGLAFAPPPVTLATGTPEASPASEPQQSYTGAVLGDPNAPVTMVIYADYQCPYCRLFASETEPQIIDDFVRDGQVKLEFREFPVLGGSDLTSGDNESSLSAQAVMCAGEQGEYLSYHDKLYANQKGENQGAFNSKRLKQFASELNLDTEAFNECLDSGRYISVLQQSVADGQALGVSATPTFLINGNLVQMTDQGYTLLKKQLEAAVETAP